MALGTIIGPHVLTLGCFTMGEDALPGLAYVPDASGVLTKAGTSATFAVYLTKLAKSGEAVTGIVLSGGVSALAGTGGWTYGQPLCYGANGTLVVATEGTDHIIAHALSTVLETAYGPVVKVA